MHPAASHARSAEWHSSNALSTGCCQRVLLPRQAALKSFDDDHNGALDEAEFERFAKSLMSTGAPASPAATQQLSCQQHL
jgi:hypothetical protein